MSLILIVIICCVATYGALRLSVGVRCNATQMAYLYKRMYFSRRQQLAILISLAIFVFYFAILHNRTETLVELDATRKVSKDALEIDKSGSLVKQGLVKTLSSIKKSGVVEVNVHQRYVETSLEEALKDDKGTGCEVPKLDPFAKEVQQFDKTMDPITCSGKDWVRCYLSTCRMDPKILAQLKNVKCTFRDIIFDSDYKRHLGSPILVEGEKPYILKESDHVKIRCTGNSIDSRQSYNSQSWSGHGVGFRSTVTPQKPPQGREETINVLIFGFDSTSKNGFIRKMPKSYKLLTEELKFTILNGYNIVGDGTPAALFPILTGKNELELPEARKTIRNSGNLDIMPFIFYKLKEDGYRTAYFEDMPWIGTFQYRFNGFMKQPADHYLRAFYLEESNDGASWWNKGAAPYCVGGTPRFELMMNITDQFFQLDGKRYAFTFIADITHDDFNLISSADDATVRFLRGLKDQGRFENTLVLVMGDHGVRYVHLRGEEGRYASVRETFQGKLEERLPLMAIHLPETLKKKRPNIQASLEQNVDALTTPHDIYAMIMDALDMRQHWNPHKIKGADLTRGLTLLEPVPRNRSCSEAGIEPHWCTCLRWETLPSSDPLHKRAADALVDRINDITKEQRELCVPRTLIEVQWVMKRKVNKAVIEFQGARDNDGYLGKFGGTTKFSKVNLQVRITVGPGRGGYEASMVYNLKDDTFFVNPREISRTNAYGNEPSCISAKHPHLNMYCYCKPTTKKS